MSNKKRTLPAAKQCRHIKADRNRCRAHPVHNSNFCFIHAPHLAAAREAARRKGGRERSRKAAVLPPDTPNSPLKSAADVAALVADTMNQVLRGQIEPRIANSVGQLATILLKAMETHALEQRVVQLESIIGRHTANLDSAFQPDSHFGGVEFVKPQSGGHA